MSNKENVELETFISTFNKNVADEYQLRTRIEDGYNQEAVEKQVVFWKYLNPIRGLVLLKAGRYAEHEMDFELKATLADSYAFVQKNSNGVINLKKHFSDQKLSVAAQKELQKKSPLLWDIYSESLDLNL
ncbi:MAG: hypothetical protein RH860_00175 [Cytophagales bacterium]